MYSPESKVRLHTGFARVSAQRPDNIAIVDAYGEWTYREAFGTSARLATYLASRGVGENDLVAVVTDRCGTLVLSLLAALMTGARFIVVDRNQSSGQHFDAVLPLSPRHWLIIGADEEIPAAVTNRLGVRASASTTLLSKDKLQLQSSLSAIPPYERAPPTEASALDDAPAYVISTSGTSGAPKFVCTTHAAALNFLGWYVASFKASESDRFALLSGLRHDPLIRDVFAPLSIGASLHIPTERQRRDPDALASWLASREVTVVHTTPVMLDMISSRLAQTLSSVRLVASGGDHLTRRQVSTARKVFPNTQILNFYGATETPQAIAWYQLDESEDVESVNGSLPIGRSVPGWRVTVRRSDEELCAAGEIGEICASSRFLVRGYLDMPEATQRSFKRDPLADPPDDRMFRTGDLGVCDRDGVLRVLGRCDRQVKVHGNRVDLDEVQVEIVKNASVAHAAVTFDARRGQIVAFVVPEPKGTFSEVALREQLVRELPIHAVPSKIILLAAMPLTANGKIDHGELKAGPHPANETSAAPQTRLEEALCRIWKEELGASEVGCQDGFYELGGSSIVAARVIARIADEVGVRLRVVDLFIHPTARTLAKFIRDRSAAEFTVRESELLKRKGAITCARDRARRING